MTTPAITALARHPLMAGVTDAQRAVIAECAHTMVFPGGTRLYAEGQPARHFFLILAGAIALQTGAPNHAPVTFQTVEAGDFVGVSWLAPPYRVSFDAHAITTTETLAFDADCLRAKCDADPALGYALMQRFMPALVERLTSARLQALNLYGDLL
ncbi:hypothetical protein CCR85_06400 [Rhodothalassium salexigens]|uniref:cyclic nucleotide-binding domain-containing protein n=1 Tax=Rhodothalassium salexigens TaxID=1086 RepID=UPI00191401B1|nr:cyclic nucleotide-binding domain-containing protein [Rhodothalassium salexigens]MBK5911121.1 hypothetical protein [Rhodothalassium salexigens]MBK5921989.1 hypothetical protein [Rhodothalassium salexigens]